MKKSKTALHGITWSTDRKEKNKKEQKRSWRGHSIDFQSNEVDTGDWHFQLVVHTHNSFQIEKLSSWCTTSRLHLWLSPQLWWAVGVKTMITSVSWDRIKPRAETEINRLHHLHYMYTESVLWYQSDAWNNSYGATYTGMGIGIRTKFKELFAHFQVAFLCHMVEHRVAKLQTHQYIDKHSRREFEVHTSTHHSMQYSTESITYSTQISTATEIWRCKIPVQYHVQCSTQINHTATQTHGNTFLKNMYM